MPGLVITAVVEPITIVTAVALSIEFPLVPVTSFKVMVKTLDTTAAEPIVTAPPSLTVTLSEISASLAKVNSFGTVTTILPLDGNAPSDV